MTPRVLFFFKHETDYTIVWWTAANLDSHLAVPTLGGFSKKVVVSRGCAQGDLLSLLL
jgi:hypothetical protein